MIDKCRKCDENGRTNEHIIAGISSLSESTYLRTGNQMAKIITNRLPQIISYLIESLHCPKDTSWNQSQNQLT